MQSFVDSVQAGRTVLHSFHNSAGEQIDCVETATQPALHGKPLATPPPMPPAPPSPNVVTQDLYSATPDSDGNARQCPSDTVPMGHISMVEVSKFSSLAAFFSKRPDR
jgi:hypothetical protein